MATYRGTVTSNEIGGQWQLCFDVYEGDYDIASNSSPITLNLHIRRTRSYYGYNGGSYSGQLRVDGEWRSNYSGSITYPTGIGTDWLFLTSVSTTAYHNSDGSYSPNISISYSGNFAPFSYGGSYSGYVTLSTIPRATPAPNVMCDVESSTSFTLSPYANFSHSVQFSFGGYTKYLTVGGNPSDSEQIYSTNVRTWNFNATSDFYNRFDGKSGSGTLKVRTYSSGTLIGTSISTLTLNANASRCSPVITGTVKDINQSTIALTGSNKTIVRYKSKPQITTSIRITSPTDKNAKLSYLYVAGNQISNVNQRIFDVENPQGKSFLIKAINSRSFTTETGISANNYVDYILPTITITSLKRTEPTTGDIDIEYKGDYFNGNFSQNTPNELTVTWKYKEKSSNQWVDGGTFTPTIKENTFSSQVTIKSVFDYKKQYDIMILVQDKLSEASVQGQLPRGYPIFWWGENFVDILGELRIQGKNPFLYSEEETIIGTWIDGKPLYQKVLKNSITISSSDTNQFEHYIENVDLIFTKLAFAHSLNGDQIAYQLPVTQYNTNTNHDELSVAVDRKNYRFLVQTDWAISNWQIYVVVNYTKTTDTGEE